MCQVFCAMLEHSHSISLTGIMTAELWPSVDSKSRPGLVLRRCQAQCAAAVQRALG